MSLDEQTLERVADALSEASGILVVTGAGISAESGVPTFRGAGGLWEGHRPEELATPEAFAEDPGKVWRFYRWRRRTVHACAPNEGHRTLAGMEGRFEDFLVATQNVDGLHRLAGSEALVELHGSLEQRRCPRCERVEAMPAEPEPDEAPLPRCARCDVVMRPHVLWFGETYWTGVLDQAQRAAERADVALVVGTSGRVWPPVAVALHARRNGALLVDVNPDEGVVSEHADVHLAAPAAEALPALWRRAGGAHA